MTPSATPAGPRDAVELALVRQMADAEWRLLRFSRAEAGLFWDRINQIHDDQRYRNFPRKDTYLPADETEAHTCELGAAANQMAGAKDHLSSLARYESSIPPLLHPGAPGA